jgi:hypothetical protein
MVYGYGPVQPGREPARYALACRTCQSLVWQISTVSPTALTLICLECGRTLAIPMPKTSLGHRVDQSLN